MPDQSRPWDKRIEHGAGFGHAEQPGVLASTPGWEQAEAKVSMIFSRPEVWHVNPSGENECWVKVTYLSIIDTDMMMYVGMLVTYGLCVDNYGGPEEEIFDVKL